MRRVNLRLVLLTFLSLCLGIFLSLPVWSGSFLAISLVVLFVLGLVAWMIVPILNPVQLDIQTAVERQKLCKQNRKRVVVLSLSILMLIFGLCLPFIESLRWDRQPAPSGQVRIEASIHASSYTKNQNLVLVLSHLSFDGQAVHKNMTVRVFEGAKSDYAVGSRIAFVGQVSDVLLFEYGIIHYNYFNNIRYQATALSPIEVLEDNLRLDERLRLSIESLLKKYFSKETFAVAYASLFGDYSFIEEDTMQSFQQTGITHLLSVSGVHITFLTMIVFFVLGLFHFKPFTRFFIVAIVLLFYAWLCAFSPTVMRATLMCLFTLFASVVGKQNDPLNSVAFSGLVLICIQPLIVFQVGFILSYACVLCIFLLYQPILKFLNKIIVSKRAAKALALNLAVQVGIVPLSIYFFSGFSWLTVLANLVLVPLFGLFFVLLVVLVCVAMILPWMGFLLFVPNLILFFVLQANFLLSSVPNSLFQVYHFDSILLFGVIIVIIFSSNYLRFSKKARLVIISISCVIVCFVSLMSHLPIGMNQSKVHFLSYFGRSSVVIQNEDNTCNLIDVGTTKKSLQVLDQFLHQNKLYRVQYLFLLETSLTDLDQNFLNKYDVKFVVTYGEEERVEKLFENSSCKSLHITKPFISNHDSHFYFAIQNSMVKGIYFNVKQKNILIPKQSLSENALAEVLAMFPSMDVLDARKTTPLTQSYDFRQVLRVPSAKKSKEGFLMRPVDWTFFI